MTAIGERGINLSGGQKARVALARALYSSKTKLMLLDDPLSAVDGHVGDHLFSKAICGDLSQGVTRILVTHHVHFLSKCDTVIVLEDGCIKNLGTYDELITAGVDLHSATNIEAESSNDNDMDESRRKKRTKNKKSKSSISHNEDEESSKQVHTSK